MTALTLLNQEDTKQLPYLPSNVQVSLASTVSIAKDTMATVSQNSCLCKGAMSFHEIILQGNTLRHLS